MTPWDGAWSGTGSGGAGSARGRRRERNRLGRRGDRRVMCVPLEAVDRLLGTGRHAAVGVADEEDPGHALLGVGLHVAVVHPRAGPDTLAGQDLEAEGAARVEVLVVDGRGVVARAFQVPGAVVGPPVGVQVEGVELVVVADG